VSINNSLKLESPLEPKRLEVAAIDAILGSHPIIFDLGMEDVTIKSVPIKELEA
jgi:hypothetical protein